MNSNYLLDFRIPGSPTVFDPDGFEFDAGLADLGGGGGAFANDWSSVSTLSSESEVDHDTPLRDIEMDIGTYYQSQNAPSFKVKEELISQDGEDEQKIINRHREVALMAPRVMKNDIRRSFPKMLFNAINCGEFQKVQDFSTAFISPTCPFVACVQTSEDVIPPPVLYGVGPRIHVHYTIGSFVMFPDMVATMGDVQIITSNRWAGTKIVIPWDCKMTKTHHIPTECWIPPPDKVEQMYAEPSIERMMAALSMGENPNSPLLLPQGRSRAHGASGRGVRTPGTPSSPKSAPHGQSNRKRPRGASPSPLQAHLQGLDKAQGWKPNQVPDSFQRCLLAGAEVVPNTPHLWTQGTYTIMLDETNHVQSIVLDVHQAGPDSQFPYAPPLH